MSISKKMKMQVKIWADDFGKSNTVNDGIIECLQRGMVTGASLMVNMPMTEQAVRMMEDYHVQNCVGFHLNLTEGYPLTQGIKKCKRFCDGEGRFNRKFHASQLSRLQLGMQEKKAVKEEIRAQLLLAMEYGAQARHLDSHHHVHTNPAIWNIIEKCLLEYDLQWEVRLSRNLYGKTKPSLGERIYKEIYNQRLWSQQWAKTDYFGSIEDFLSSVDAWAANTVCEVMTHPKMHNGIIYDGEMEFSKKICSFQNL